MDPRVAKIQSLIDHGATEGEREAARQAMARLKAAGVNTEPPPNRPGARVNYGTKGPDLDDVMKDYFQRNPIDHDFVSNFIKDLFTDAGIHTGAPPPRSAATDREKIVRERLKVALARLDSLQSEVRAAKRDVALIEAELEFMQSGKKHHGRVHYDV